MSRLPFELLLALRYLRPKRTFVSVITLISVVGVSLGVAVLIIVLSVMTGFDHRLRDQILGFNTHLEVTVAGRTIRNYPALVKEISKNPLIKAAGPLIVERVLIKTEPEFGQPRAEAPFLRGMDPQLETNLTVLPNKIVEGAFDVSDRGLLIGNEFADMMNLSVGDKVIIYSPSDLRKWEEAYKQEQETDEKPGTAQKKRLKLPAPPHFEVRGIFHVGYYEFDANWIIGALEDAQELYNLSNTVHGIMVILQDPYTAPEAARQLETQLGSEYRVSTWLDKNSNLLNALIVEKNVMFYLLFFIMIVAALCILSALITFVVQKTREIGMLKALGATDLQVSGLFLSQGALVGGIGDLIGFGLGMLALRYRNEFLHLLDRIFGFQLFPPSIYGFHDLPSLIVPKDVILICGSAWIVCILGGFIPAWRAGRLKPVEALRYE
jgi:lipoprotein-releasing system permease protein